MKQRTAQSLKADPVRLPTLPEDFEPTPPQGLTEAEAEQRRAQGLDNCAPEEPGKSWGAILAGNIFTLFNLLNAAMGLALALVGAWRNMLFLLVIISNTVVATVQEIRSHAVLRKLRLAAEAPARVIRGGREAPLPPHDAVLGDLVVLRAGDQVIADAVVREGTAILDESLLTGEQDGVEKQEGALLLSGSFVREGTLTAQLSAVGKDSYLNQLTQRAKEIKAAPAGLLKDMKQLVRVLSFVLVPTGILLGLKQFFLLHSPVESAVSQAVAAMVGMLPEGLVLLTSIALTAGVVRLAGKRTLVQTLYGIETLARVDTLCLDKTGTLTTGEMQVERLIPLGCEEKVLRQKLSRYLGAENNDNATSRALKQAFQPDAEPAIGRIPFSSRRKYSALAFADGTVLTLGAPRMIPGLPDRSNAPEEADRAAQGGFRVLLLCEGQGNCAEGNLPASQQPLGLVVLSDTLRPNVRQTLAYFRHQQVDIRIISGDSPVTVSAIAQNAGLEGAERAVDVSRLPDDEAVRRAADAYTVFGRVTPDRKKLLVEALQHSGHTVGMTGDGINDIPALKAADCSISLAGGSDAARQVSQIVLLDADFAHLPDVVREGRRVINNITRTASLFLVKTIYSLLLSLLFLAIPLPYPFQPIQLTLISALTVGIPSFFLAMEPNGDPIRNRFLRNIIRSALPGGLSCAVCAVAASCLSWRPGLPPVVCSALAACAVFGLQWFTLLNVCLPLSPLRAVICALSAAGFILAMLTAGSLFLFPSLAGRYLLALLALLAAGLAVWMAARRILNKEHGLRNAV